MTLSIFGCLGGMVGISYAAHVAIAITAMNRGTEPMADSPHPALFREDVKGATGPHEYSSHVDALFRACGDDSPNDIPCLVALDRFTSFGFGAREADLVDIALLPAAMPRSRNQQGNDASDLKIRRCTPAHTGGIDPMFFRQVSLSTVELRETT